MKSIADAFAAKLAELVNGIDAAEFNPVQCCVCAAVGLDGKVQAVVRGYGTCTRHMLSIDEAGSLAAAIQAIRPEEKTPRSRSLSRQTG